MKKILLFLFTFSCFLFAKGQALDQDQNHTQNIRFGFKTGINFANISGISDNNLTTTKSHIGIYAGFLLKIPLNETFSLQPELYYSQQGFNQEIKNYGSVKYNIDYIQFPILLKTYIISGFNIQLGPQFGYKISETSETNIRPNTSTNPYEYFEDIDIGFVIGLEYEFDKQFFINFHYIPGITETIKNSDIKNSVFQLGFGMLL